MNLGAVTSQFYWFYIYEECAISVILITHRFLLDLNSPHQEEYYERFCCKRGVDTILKV